VLSFSGRLAFAPLQAHNAAFTPALAAAQGYHPHPTSAGSVEQRAAGSYPGATANGFEIDGEGGRMCRLHVVYLLDLDVSGGKHFTGFQNL
jgi:hypothetical protein